MSILSSAHVHTTYCDGKTPAADMARGALEKGFVSLGFTSHAPQHFDFPYCIHPDREDEYKAEIRALKKEYEGRMTIYLGIERDYYSCADPRNYEFYIASVHYLKYGDGHHAPIDGSPDTLARYVREECGGDGLLMARRYYALLQSYVIESRPPIIGHFDLVRKNNSRLHFFDESTPAYRRLALETLEAMAGTGALLEVNTGAIARGTLSTPYPEPFLLTAWKQWGGEVIVNSDCHDVRFLDCYYDESEALLRSLGYDHAVRLGRDQLWERFPL